MTGDDETAPLNPLPETAGNLAEYEVGLDKAIENYRPAAQEIRVTQNATPETPYDLSDFHAKEAAGYAGAIRENVSPEDWGEVEASFDGLSSEGKTTVLQHLAMGTTGSATPLTESELAELVDELDIAPDLIAFWGEGQAARKFGVLRQRFTLLREYMSADDWNKVLKLYYEGPTAAAIAISCAMAG